MAESSPKSAVIISKLQSSDFSNIDVLFFDYLSPFTFLPSPPPPTLIRSLAKSFLSFLNQSLSLLPKILLCRPPLDSDHSSKLLSSYDLSLKCLESISSQLSCKPYNVQLNRMYYMRCLEWCGKREKAEEQGFRILEEVKEFKQAGVARKKKGKLAKKNKYVAEVDEETDDKELISLVVETVVGIVKCVCLRKSDDCEDYKRVTDLVKEVSPWFRLLEASVQEKLHKVLLLYLENCILYMVGKLSCFDGKLVLMFCSTTFMEYSISSSRDQIFKLARRICSSLLSQQNTNSSHLINMLQCVLTSIVSECKAGSHDAASRFTDLVSYCANTCLGGSGSFCFSVAECLEEISAEFCQEMTCYSLLLRVFAIRLRFVDCTTHDSISLSRTSTRKSEDFKLSSFLDEDTQLQKLAALFGSLRYLLQSCGIFSDTSVSDKANVRVPPVPNMEFMFGTSEDITSNKPSICLCLFDALKFLCETLAEIVNSNKFEILGTEGATTFSSNLNAVLDALLMCGDVFIHLQSCMLEEESREFSEKNKFVVNVAVAAFIISFRVQPNAKPSLKLIQHLMSDGCLKPQRLKSLFASLYNVGLTLYRSSQLTKALLAFKWSCRASWVCVSLLSKLAVKKSEGFSETFLVETASEACRISAYYIDVLHQCSSDKVHKKIAEILQSWSFAVNLFKNLPIPAALVKQWVKIACNRSADVSVEDTAATLHCLLSTSKKVPNDSVGILLDQELLAYESLKTTYPEFCKRMQMKIIDILLQKVYVARESWLQRSRTFMKKGKTLRMHGIKGLEDCILCFSEAITLLKDACGKSNSLSCTVRHQLAISYCLRALATQEASSNSKIFEDIQSAVNIWLSITDNDLMIEECGLVSSTTMLLLYHIMDLVSLKGHTKFLKDMYKLIFTLFKWKNIPTEKYIPLLWEYRRLNHALCASPVNEPFLMSLEEVCGATSKSIEYWLGCLSGSQQLRLGFEQNFSYLFNICSLESHYQRGSFRLNITAQDVEEAALALISNDHVPSKSVFLVGNLYHDLAERFLLNGQLVEGLFYAKEAHKLRNKLFKENFSISTEKQSTKHDTSKETAESCSDDLHDLRSLGTKVWSNDEPSFSLETCYLSPWNVLRSYLESFLQVGIIHELLGNGSEAEMLLVWGRNISRSQGLPLFSVAFSTVLGKLYRNKRDWDLAESELGNAKGVLFNVKKDTCCLKCRLMFESNVEQQFGDIFRRQLNDCSGSCSSVSSNKAENVYKSAVEKLKVSEWKNLVSCPEGVRTTENCHFVAAQFDKNVATKVRMEVKRSRRTKKATNNFSQEQQSVPEQNLRITRSRSRSCKNKTANLSGNLQDGLVTTSDGCKICSVVDPLSSEMSMLQIENSAVDAVDSGYDVTHSSSTVSWHSVQMEVLESASINNFIFLKWEFVRRRQLVQLLLGLGKCLEACGQVHETHKVYLESIAVLSQRNLFCDTNYSSKETSVDLIGKELPRDGLAMEHASVLYYVSRFSLKSYGSSGTRVSCCELSQVDAPTLVSWLLVAFVLCRDVPHLLQKVSRLLALMYVLSASSKSFSFHTLLSKGLSHSHCASFFHQASIGTQINNQLLSSMVCKCDSQDALNSKVHAGFTPNGPDTWNMIRLVPESLKELDNFVANFFHGLPCATVVCFSLLGGSKATLLRKLLHYPSSVHAWILLSRLNSTSQPVVVLLPLDSVLKDDTSSSIARKLFEENDGDKRWHCPWGSTVVDYAAPVFRELLKRNYITSSDLEDTKSNRLLWWTQRKELDQRFCKFLSDLEELWLGSWKYLLRGTWPDCSQLDSIEKKLMRDLRRKCKLNVNQSLLRILLCGAKDACHNGIPIEKLLQTGCFVGRVRNSVKKHKMPADIPDEAGSLSNICLQLVLEAANHINIEVPLSEPTILVLDWEIQMLPFENIPILRKEEVYRMPSVGSITATLNRSRHHLQQAGGIIADFPLIDPLDAYYLLNPGGDLHKTQLQFESWFRDQKLEGKVGGAPTAEELAIALKEHDLFIYLGHGSGSQYISGNKIQKLDYCAATFLMGCSSGSLSLNGCYAPRGIPLSYLLAGSPLIVANLWEVTDKDIDRFGRAMLDSWLRERAASSSDCSQRRKIGSFMGQAREACTLPFLTGAAPVCYGVPTGIWKKKDP